MRRILLILASVGLLTALAAAPASAQYTQPALTVSDTTLTIGQPFVATATTLQPGSSGTFSFNSTPIVLGNATADASGTASGTFTTPNVALGAHTVTYTGTDANGAPTTLSASVTVVGNNAVTPTTVATTSTLPRTGSNSTGTLLPIAAVLVAGGALLVIITRKRNSVSA